MNIQTNSAKKPGEHAQNGGKDKIGPLYYPRH